MIATTRGLPTSFRAGKWASDIAVLEEGDMTAMAGDRQHLLAGRASCGLRICLLHIVSHLHNTTPGHPRLR